MLSCYCACNLYLSAPRLLRTKPGNIRCQHTENLSIFYNEQLPPTVRIRFIHMFICTNHTDCRFYGRYYYSRTTAILLQYRVPPVHGKQHFSVLHSSSCPKRGWLRLLLLILLFCCSVLLAFVHNDEEMFDSFFLRTKVSDRHADLTTTIVLMPRACGVGGRGQALVAF